MKHPINVKNKGPPPTNQKLGPVDSGFVFSIRKKIARFAETRWENDIHGRFRLGEGETYRHEIDSDSDMSLSLSR